MTIYANGHVCVGGELPDFFGGDRSAPAEGAGAAEDDELNSLTFGDGFDVPLAGLPEFFSMLGDAPAAISAAAAAEDDDLAAITGAATTTDWSTNAAKFADLQAQYLRDMQLKRVSIVGWPVFTPDTSAATLNGFTRACTVDTRANVTGCRRPVCRGPAGRGSGAVLSGVAGVGGR